MSRVSKPSPLRYRKQSCSILTIFSYNLRKKFCSTWKTIPFPGKTHAISFACIKTARASAPPHLGAELGPLPLSLAYENWVRASLQEPFRVLVLFLFLFLNKNFQFFSNKIDQQKMQILQLHDVQLCCIPTDSEISTISSVSLAILSSLRANIPFNNVHFADQIRTCRRISSQTYQTAWKFLSVMTPQSKHHNFILMHFHSVSFSFFLVLAFKTCLIHIE